MYSVCRLLTVHLHVQVGGSAYTVVLFLTFYQQIRSKGDQPSNEDILRFSKLFEDQITLDNMSRAQLKAINRLLMLPTIGTNNLHQIQPEKTVLGQNYPLCFGKQAQLNFDTNSYSNSKIYGTTNMHN